MPTPSSSRSLGRALRGHTEGEARHVAAAAATGRIAASTRHRTRQITDSTRHRTRQVAGSNRHRTGWIAGSSRQTDYRAAAGDPATIMRRPAGAAGRAPGLRLPGGASSPLAEGGAAA